MGYLARVRDELAAKGITSDTVEPTAASSSSSSCSRLSSSSVSSFPTSTWRHVSVVAVGTSASTLSSVSATAAGGGGQAVTTLTSRIYPALTSPVGNNSSSAWRPSSSSATGTQVVATTVTRPLTASGLTSQTGASTPKLSSP